MFKLFATPKGKSGQVVRFKISGMHCVSCSLNIDGELEDLPGVISASTSYAKAVCEVSFDGKKMKEKQIQDAIKKLGYEATLLLD